MRSEEITNFLNKTLQNETLMTKLNAAAKVQMSIDPRLLSMTQLANSATAALSRTPSMPRLVEAVANFQAQEQQRELDVASLSTSSDLLARIRARRSPAETRCKRCLRASEPCSLKPMRRRPSASERLPQREERMIALNESAIAVDQSQYQLNRRQYMLAKCVGAISATALGVALLANHII